MHVLKKVGIATGLVASAALSLALALPAQADTAAQTGDAVGVGSDTLQNGADFVFDGAPGVAGAYNTTGNLNRAVNVFATGDANGRALYDGTCGTPAANGVGSSCATTAGTPNSLVTSVILRAGTKPVLRPNGSGQGVAALTADAATGYNGLPAKSIQFARMSRLPTSQEETNCDGVANGACGGLHVFQAATDGLAVAHITNGYNGPTALSAQELVSIYQCTTTTWNALPGNTAGSTATIHPLIPQSGSGTRNFFLADLALANGGNTVTPGSCVRTVQEHDPTGIYSDATPANAIEPFSTGKLALINSGYFANGVNSPSGTTNGAYAPNYLTATTTGTAGDNNPTYYTARGLYFVVRQSDFASTTPFQAGSSQNFVQQLFSGGGSAIRSATGRSELAAAGFITTLANGTSNYKDCGLDPASC